MIAVHQLASIELSEPLEFTYGTCILVAAAGNGGTFRAELPPGPSDPKASS